MRIHEDSYFRFGGDDKIKCKCVLNYRRRIESVNNIQPRVSPNKVLGRITPQTVIRVEFHPASNMAEHGKWRFYGMPIDNIELV